MQHFVAIVRRADKAIHSINQRIMHRLQHVLHCTYLGAAAAEAHGIYSIAAGALLLVVIVSFFAGQVE